MEEITLEYLEEHFDEIMDEIMLHDKGYLLRTPDGEGIILTPKKNEYIEKMEKSGLIKELK